MSAHGPAALHLETTHLDIEEDDGAEALATGRKDLDFVRHPVRTCLEAMARSMWTRMHAEWVFDAMPDVVWC